MKNYSIITFLILFSIGVKAQYISKEKALDDLNYLAQSIETYNASLDKFTPHYREEVDSLLNGIHSSPAFFEYFQLVSQITVMAREAHFNLGNWQDTFHSGFMDNRYKYLPLKVKVLKNKVYIWDSYLPDTTLQRGDEILLLNGKTISGVVGQMLIFVPRDGNITGYPIKRVGDGFNWMYYLFVEQPETFHLQIRKYKTADIVEHSFPALTRVEMTKNVANKFLPKKESAIKENAVYDFEIGEGKATLTLKTFNRSTAEENKVKADKLYKSVFKEVEEKNIKTLVIDLRNNFGGRNEFADEMLPYLLKLPADGYFKKSISWEGKEKVYKMPAKSKYAFHGKIYVLVNQYTYSSAGTLARYLREYSNATFIGSETGTRYEGYAAGSTQTVTLPNSGLRIGIPRYVYVYPESIIQKTKNEGLVPDVEVDYTIDNLINESDLHLETLQKLLK